ncbi:MAG: MATE family efflux transporter [Thomasclavelia sp.]
MNSQDTKLINGVIWKQLLVFFVPILIGTFFQQLYNTVDTIIVGQYLKTTALAAVGSTGNLTNLVVNFFVGLSSGATVVIAQYFGSDNHQGVFKAVHTSFALSLVCGLLMSLFGCLFAYQSLDLLGVPKNILGDAALYMQIYFLGMIPSVIYNMGAGILRAVGDSKTPLYYLVVCTIINVVFDFVFIAYLNIGIAGAALATIIAQFVSAILVVRKLIKATESYQLVIRKIAFDYPILKRIIKIGIPAGLQSTMYSISNLLLQTKINLFDTNTIAAWAVYIKIDALFWMVSGAFGSSITTFVGQNYGAGMHQRIKKGIKTSLAMFFSAAILLSCLLSLFASQVSSLFSSDPSLITNCNEIIHFLTPFYFTYCIVEILSGTMRGCGDSFKPMLLVCGGICLFRVVWVLFVTLTTFKMIIVSYPISWALTSLLFVLYYFRFKKLYLH